MSVSNPGAGHPIDLEFLTHQTMGDDELKFEVLELFVRQASTYELMAKQAEEPAAIRRVAHTIKGAAKGIGAKKLTEIAIMAEDSERFDFQALGAELQRISEFVASLRSDN